MDVPEVEVFEIFFDRKHPEVYKYGTLTLVL